MNRIPSVGTPPQTKSGRAPTPEGASLVYLLRVGTLTLAMIGLPFCAVFLPSVKKALARTVETASTVVSTNAVSSPALLKNETDVRVNFGETQTLEKTGAFNETFEPIVFADSARQAPQFERLTNVDAPSNGVAPANFEEPANSWTGGAVASVSANIPTTANFTDFPGVPNAANVGESDADALSARLQAELRSRGLEGAVVERWGARFWRASGRTPTNPATGLAEYCEAIDADPIAAAQSALDHYREKTATFRTAAPNDGVRRSFYAAGH